MADDDWGRSSFFNADTEQSIAVPLVTPEPDEDESNDDFNIDDADNNNNNNNNINNNHHHNNNNDNNFNDNNMADSIPKIENPIMNELVHIMINRFEHLVERGFLNPAFLTKIRNDPQEILRFIRQNRAVVGDQLNRRLNPSIRPTPEQLERKGIVPKGYFTKGHHSAMTRKHRRKSTAQQDLAALIQLRPKPEQMVAKGIVDRSTMERYIELDDNKMDEELNYSIQRNRNNNNNDNDDDEKKYNDNDNDNDRNGSIINDLQNENISDQIATTTTTNREQQTWEISILGTLLFKTIAEALRKSCLDTQKQEALVLLQMEEMNNEMKHLRDALDKYFLNDEPDVLLFQREEEMIRDKFHGIQKKLLSISTKQNAIHSKLRILHSVERRMIDLQNIYDKQLGQLRCNEEDVLKDLKEQRIRREKAIKIRIAEKSHSNWAMAKLDYTISVALHHGEIINDDIFINDLDGFLTSLRSISENQNNIVRDFDFAIDELESHLLSIRHDMSKVRTMTFKKIYDLHKQVEIAESLELGNRRLSVASATEIERERRHHQTKIRRQLNTLNNQIKIFNYKIHEKNLREIIDIQLVMSDNKLKSFFSVFTQSMSQTICDINICYQNLNCLIDDDKENIYDDRDDSNSSNSSNNSSSINNQQAIISLHDENRMKIKSLCMELYGITNILFEINLYQTNKKHDKNMELTLVEKIIHCMKFIQICKNALLYDLKKTYYQMNGGDDDGNNLKFKIDTNRINEIIIIIARKLSIDHHMIDDIDRTNDDEIPFLAQMRVKTIFESIIRAQDLNKIFDRKPLSAMHVATYLLKNIFDIDNNEENHQYFI